MFTIKHVGEYDDDNEALYATPEVTRTRNVCAPNSDGAVGYKAGNEWKFLHGGVVYVMNEHGATVAKYDMRVPSAALPNKVPHTGGLGIVANG